MIAWIRSRFFLMTMAGWMAALNVLPGVAWALPSDRLSGAELSLERRAYIEQINQALDQPAARRHLRAMGVDSATLETRLAQLDDQTLQRVAAQAQTVRVAGDAVLVVGVGTLLLILLIVLILALVTD